MSNTDLFVTPFELPQSAGPKDRKIGENDAGFDVYETVTGEQYWLRPKEDQRTTRQKVEDKDFLQGV